MLFFRMDVVVLHRKQYHTWPSELTALLIVFIFLLHFLHDFWFDKRRFSRKYDMHLEGDAILSVMNSKMPGQLLDVVGSAMSGHLIHSVIFVRFIKNKTLLNEPCKPCAMTKKQAYFSLTVEKTLVYYSAQ